MTRAGRFTLAVLAGTLTVLVGSVVVAASESNIADSFPTVGSYSANTGLETWTGPWTEETESDGPSAGDMRVVQSGSCVQASNCLRIGHSVLIPAQAIHRIADLAGAEQAVLQFSLSRQGLGAASVTVQAVGNGTESKNYPVSADTPTVHTLDISDVVGGATRIRFETFGLGVGMDLFVDNVRIDLVYPDTTTTTTLAPSTTTTLAVTTTTSAPPSSSTTTRPTTTTTRGSSTTTVDESATTTTVPPAQSGSDQTPPNPATGFELDLARLSGVTLNMAPEPPADLGFKFGVNPVTGLTVNFSSVVEIIKAEFLSALGLGTMVAFFAVGGWKREDEEENGEDEGPLSRS
ncbi:MAG: hypothetical protein WEF28_07635 [Acidimicrobiia bacterium]